MKKKWAAPLTQTSPQKGWAAVSDDVPPMILEVHWYKDQLTMRWLRTMPVMVVPDNGQWEIKRKPPRNRAAKAPRIK